MKSTKNAKGNLNVLGNTIRKYRKVNHLSQAQLAAKLQVLGIDIHKNSVQKLECNNRIIKDFELAGISKILNVSIDLLLKDFIENLP